MAEVVNTTVAVVSRSSTKLNGDATPKILEGDETTTTTTPKVATPKVVVPRVVPPGLAAAKSRFRKAILSNLVHTRKEAQAQQTLTIVLVVFVASYFPVFSYITSTSLLELILARDSSTNTNLTVTSIKENGENGVGGAEQQMHKFLLDNLFYFTTWIGYSAAAMNPLIHLFLNKNFKSVLFTYFRRPRPTPTHVALTSS